MLAVAVFTTKKHTILIIYRGSYFNGTTKEDCNNIEVERNYLFFRNTTRLQKFNLVPDLHIELKMYLNEEERKDLIYLLKASNKSFDGKEFIDSLAIMIVHYWFWIV